MTTLYHLMERALWMQEQLEIDILVCVYHQAIFAEAVEIQLKEPSLVCFYDGDILHTFNVSWDHRHKF